MRLLRWALEQLWVGLVLVGFLLGLGAWFVVGIYVLYGYGP